MTTERFPEIAKLSDENKLTFMSELCQDVTDDAADESPELAAFVEQCWQEYLQHPERVSSWSQVKARIVASRAWSAR